MKRSYLFSAFALLFFSSVAFSEQDPAKKKTVGTTEKEKSLSAEEVKKAKMANTTYTQNEQKSATPYSGVPTSGTVKLKKDELVTPVVDASTPK